MQTRLMVCAHMKDAGHRGVVATLQRLQGYCCWFRVEVDVPSSSSNVYMHGLEGGLGSPAPLGETVHGM